MFYYHDDYPDITLKHGAIELPVLIGKHYGGKCAMRGNCTV
jgi:hypothetical protein